MNYKIVLGFILIVLFVYSCGLNDNMNKLSNADKTIIYSIGKHKFKYMQQTAAYEIVLSRQKDGELLDINGDVLLPDDKHRFEVYCANIRVGQKNYERIEPTQKELKKVLDDGRVIVYGILGNLKITKMWGEKQIEIRIYDKNNKLVETVKTEEFKVEHEEGIWNIYSNKLSFDSRLDVFACEYLKEDSANFIVYNMDNKEVDSFGGEWNTGAEYKGVWQPNCFIKNGKYKIRYVSEKFKSEEIIVEKQAKFKTKELLSKTEILGMLEKTYKKKFTIENFVSLDRNTFYKNKYLDSEGLEYFILNVFSGNFVGSGKDVYLFVIRIPKLDYGWSKPNFVIYDKLTNNVFGDIYTAGSRKSYIYYCVLRGINRDYLFTKRTHGHRGGTNYFNNLVKFEDKWHVSWTSENYIEIGDGKLVGYILNEGKEEIIRE